MESFLREVAVPLKILPWRFASRGWSLSAFAGRIFNAIAFSRMARIAKKINPDIIEGDINDYSLLRYLSTKTRAAIVCRVRSHDVFTRDLSDSAFIDKFIPLSRRLKAPLLRAGVPESKIEIINDGVDVQHFVPEEQASKPHPLLRVGIVGRIEPFKRTLECLRVARALVDAGTSFSFFFIGANYRPEYFQEVMETRKALVLEEVCHFVPETGAMREFYHSIDVLLTLSGGSVMLEAMAMGKPVVAATPVSRVEHSIIKHGETGLLYDQDDLAGVAEGLSSLAKSPELIKKLGKAGRQKVVAEFDIENLITQTMEIYQGVTGR